MASYSSTRRRRSRRDGYVLVMTLVVLGVAVATLARLAGRSLSLAQSARAHAVDLQQEWGALSCRLRLVESAEAVLGDQAAQFEQQGIGWPHPSRVEGGVSLGETNYHYVIVDEQAKLNLNGLWAKRPDQAPQLLSLAAREAGASPPLRLRPTPRVGREAAHRYFENWGQVVDLAALAARSGDVDDLLALSHGFTCWGDGRLNVTRAGDAALMALAKLELTAAEAHQVVEARRGFAGELSDLLDTVDIPRRKLLKLRRRLTDRSSCHTLWLVEGSGASEKLTLVVREPGRRGAAERQVFVWP